MSDPIRRVLRYCLENMLDIEMRKKSFGYLLFILIEKVIVQIEISLSDQIRSYLHSTVFSCFAEFFRFIWTFGVLLCPEDLCS